MRTKIKGTSAALIAIMIGAGLALSACDEDRPGYNSDYHHHHHHHDGDHDHDHDNDGNGPH
jgi:hypothetical protein